MAYQGNSPAPHLTICTPHISQKALSFHHCHPLMVLPQTPTSAGLLYPQLPVPNSTSTPSGSPHSPCPHSAAPVGPGWPQAVSTAKSSAPRGVQHRGELPPPPALCAPPAQLRPPSAALCATPTRPPPPGYICPQPGLLLSPAMRFPTPPGACWRACSPSHPTPLPCPSRCPPTCRRSGRTDLPAVSHGSGIGAARAAPRTPAPSSSGRRCPE